MQILTQSGSVYNVDTKNHTVSGGKLGTQVVPYKDCKLMKGCIGIFTLTDGRILQTSTIVRYGPSVFSV